jgi:hypothetical protein
MARGRPSKGPKLADKLDGSEQARRRLRVILETVAGERTVGEACDELGVSESAFYALRTKMLSSALESLEPKPAGRKRPEKTEADERIEELEAEVGRLQIHLRASQTREEIALVMPHILEPPEGSQAAGSKKKTPPKRQKKAKRKRRPKRRGHGR